MKVCLYTFEIQTNASNIKFSRRIVLNKKATNNRFSLRALAIFFKSAKDMPRKTKHNPSFYNKIQCTIVTLSYTEKKLLLGLQFLDKKSTHTILLLFIQIY